MKNSLLHIAILFAYCIPALAQPVCSRTSVGYPPINDLGTVLWRGQQGGLYPNGSNQCPPAHNSAGLAIAQNVVALNATGNIDTANGKIVWLSVGMSNTTFETQVFLPLANALSDKNPKLTLVDGAQGGQDINIIINPNAPFWSNINTRLQQAGVTPAQVQAVWFKEAEAQPSDTSFNTYPDALKVKFKIAMQIMKAKFPNLKLCYLTSRIYAGYASSNLNLEPYAYYSGWSVKRLIQDQIDGDTALTYSGSAPRAPWLAWGPYPWADGTTPRSDSLTWICPDDFNSDGTHPSPTSGRQKIADMLLKFFTTDATATPWFLKQFPTAIATVRSTTQRIQIYPQPAVRTLTIVLPQSATVPANIAIHDQDGRLVKQISTGGKTSLTIDVSSLSPGSYWIVGNNFAERFIKN